MTENNASGGCSSAEDHPESCVAVAPLISLSFAPLEQYLASFRASVTQDVNSLRSELSSAHLRIQSLEERLESSQQQLQYQERVSRSYSSTFVSLVTMSSVLKRLASYLNTLDPNTSEGDEGPADWLRKVIIIPDRDPSAGGSSGNTSPMLPPVQSRTDSVGGFPSAKRQGSLSAASEGSPSGISPRNGAAGFPIRGVAGGDARMKGIIRSEINAWYEEIGLVDAEARHAKTVAALSRAIQQVQDEKVSVSTCTGWMDALRSESRGVRDESALVKKRCMAVEALLEEQRTQSVQSLTQVHQSVSQRIDNIYATFGFKEILAPSASSAPSGSNGAVVPPPTTAGGPLAAPTPQPATVADAVPVIQDSQQYEVDDDGNRLAITSEVTSAVLRSTSFVTLRQKILDDLVERLSSNRTATASEIGVEMYAIRNDLKSRPTAGRVLEIIKEQVNVPALLSRCDQLSRQLEALESNVVLRDDFVTSLKTKADVTAMELRLTRDEFHTFERVNQSAFEAVGNQIQLVMDERQEISKIFRDVVMFYKRDVAKSNHHQQQQQQPPLHSSLTCSSNNLRGSSTGAHGKTREGLSLEDAAQNDLQRIIHQAAADPRGYIGAGSATPSGLSESRGQGGSRAGGRPRNQIPVVLKPLTESRAQNQSNIPFPPPPSRGNGATPSSRFTSPPPPHQPTGASDVVPLSKGGSPAAVPLTAHQEAYAKYVSEEQMKHMIEGLPPLPYEPTAAGKLGKGLATS